MALRRVLWWWDWKEKGQMKGPGPLEISLKNVIPEPELWARVDGAKENWAVATLVGGFPSGQREQTPSKGHQALWCKVFCSNTWSATGSGACWSCTVPKALIKKGMRKKKIREWACLGVIPIWAWRKYSFAYFLLFCPLPILSFTAPCNLCLNQLWKKANFCIRCFWTFSIAYTLKSFREIFCNWNMHTWSALTVWVLFRVTAMASHFFPEGLVSAIENLILVLIIQGSLGAYIFSTTKFIILFIGP